MRGDVIVRAMCFEPLSRDPLLLSGVVDVIDLCLTHYGEELVETINKAFIKEGRVFLALATPLLGLPLLVYGRALHLFEEIDDLEATLLLNPSDLGSLKYYIWELGRDHESDPTKIIEKVIRQIVAARARHSIKVEAGLGRSHSKIAVRVRGLSGNERASLEYCFELRAELEQLVSVHVATLSEMLFDGTIEGKGFITVIDLGYVEGAFTRYIKGVSKHLRVNVDFNVSL